MGIDRDYAGLHFERQRLGKAGAVRLLGSGHKVFDLALKDSMDMTLFDRSLVFGRIDTDPGPGPEET